MSTRLRVLMVEDCEDSCLLIGREIQKHGYDPTALRVDSAPLMRRALAEQQWDVIIADFVVPNFDALASLQVAREHAPELPFIVVSGNLGEELAVEVMKAGAQDYVTKGNLARLVPAIERGLRDAEMRRARHRAEAALEKKETLSRAVLDSLTAEIAVIDKDGVILATNAAWHACCRNGAAQVIPHPAVGANFLDIFREPVNGAMGEKALAGIRGVLEGSLANFTCDYSRSSASGSDWFLLHATPLVNYGGAVVSHVDLTATKETEIALRQSEARFRGVVESLGEGLLLADADDQVFYANSRMAQLTGYSAEEMGSRPVSALLRMAGDAGPVGTRPTRSELQLVRKNGSTLWVEVNAAPLRDPHGQIIGTIHAVTDISERRQAREALRKSQAGLLLAQRIGHVGSWELDIASRSMEWSAESYRIFDLAPESTPPSFQRFLDLVAQEDRSRVSQGFERALTEGSFFRGDCRIVRPDGTERVVHIQAQLILDSSDRPVQMIGTVQDITERKVLEEQVRQSQKMEAVGQLAGGIAHDFNNILTVIQGYTELISYQTELDQQTRSYADQIAISAERASKLTRQLLTFSRKQLMQVKTLDVNAWLNELGSMLQRLLGEQSRLHLNIQADLPHVRADSGMLEQVLVNLVVNARDAMPRGGKLIIETSLHEIDSDYCRIHPESAPGQFICLGVIDTGSGMDAKTLHHMFEPFFTTKEVGRGTGLGLSTVYGIVKQHQGWITVASELGRGSAFKVFLPVTQQSSSPSLPPILGKAAGGGTETILLVEDEPPLRQLARSTLERCGYRVLEAGSGPEALTVWEQSSVEIDLLLTDMVMPGGMTGRELALGLLAEDNALKVLYTSGYSLEFVESDLLLREGVNFLPKPYSGASLGQAVRACLDRKGG